MAAQPRQDMGGILETCILAKEHGVAERRLHQAQQAAAQFETPPRGVRSGAVTRRGEIGCD